MKTYFIIVRYDMLLLKDGGEMLGDYLFADSYLVKLIKDLDDVVYLGRETEIGLEDSMPREHFFKAEGLDATLEAMAAFSDQDEDFGKSFMDLDKLGDDGALTMEYKEIPYEPITEEEREYSRESIEHDPRDTLKLMEEDVDIAMEILEEEGLLDEDDDDEDPN